MNHRAKFGAVTDGAHRAEQSGGPERRPKAHDVYWMPWSECAMVRPWGSPAPDGHLHGVDHELGTDVIGDGPADHPAAPGVEDDAQVDLALFGRVLGHVHHPQRSGSVRLNLRWTRSSDGVASGSRRVQPRHLRRWMPTMPAWAMSRATRLREQRRPRPSPSRHGPGGCHRSAGHPVDVEHGVGEVGIGEVRSLTGLACQA